MPENAEEKPGPEQEARDRRAANLFLLVAAVLLIGMGVWLVDAMVKARRARRLHVGRPAQLLAGRNSGRPLAAH